MSLIILEIINTVYPKSKCYFNFHIFFYFVEDIRKILLCFKRSKHFDGKHEPSGKWRLVHCVLFRKN